MNDDNEDFLFLFFLSWCFVKIGYGHRQKIFENYRSGEIIIRSIISLRYKYCYVPGFILFIISRHEHVYNIICSFFETEVCPFEKRSGRKDVKNHPECFERMNIELCKSYQNIRYETVISNFQLLSLDL